MAGGYTLSGDKRGGCGVVTRHEAVDCKLLLVAHAKALPTSFRLAAVAGYCSRYLRSHPALYQPGHIHRLVQLRQALKWTPLSRPSFARNKLMPGGVLGLSFGGGYGSPPLAIPALESALGSHPCGALSSVPVSSV